LDIIWQYFTEMKGIFMDKMIEESVAILFCHRMNGKDLNRERAVFCRFIQQDFNCKCSEANELLERTIDQDYNIDTHISIINNALHNEVYSKMSILKQLNHLMHKSNIRTEDYEFFEKVKKSFFASLR